MPAVEDLPEDLQGLARRQAHELSDRRWDYDQDELIRLLKKSSYNENNASFRYRIYNNITSPIIIIGGIIVVVAAGLYFGINGWKLFVVQPPRLEAMTPATSPADASEPPALAAVPYLLLD